MIKYKPVKLQDGQWAVQVGRARNGRANVLPTRFENESKAAYAAEVATAKAALDEVRRLVQHLTVEDAKVIGHMADDIIDTVLELCERHDPDYDSSDPRGFLA